MKPLRRGCKTPPSVTVRLKPHSVQTLQIRRGLWVKPNNGQDIQGPSERSQQQERAPKMTLPLLTVHREEMASYFKLFDDDLIQNFLWMDCCRKITDKYLLAMAFVYFKRARFTVAEYTRKNFFIALYLANTMEEEEEDIKYEIFPWALGRNWKKRFCRFLKQRDKLWSRIGYRAAVSRSCCEEVMAIAPSHFLWQRERSEQHSGAQRWYGERENARKPRGPFASPVFCELCNHSAKLGQTQTQGACSPLTFFCAQTPNLTYPHPFSSLLTLEATPPISTSSCRKAMESKSRARHSSCCCAEEVPRDDSSYDTALDWISEE